MRLRLIVKRHGLPDTPIVWVIDTTSQPSPTISQLLESVNEAIPIESDGEWGLEDYAVELRGTNGVNYECLHFQHVATVMKEDDEVIIRPLLTQDLKIRRVSGRRQISAEGKHLFDGLAFGRPLLRRPADRPPIKIPPRKKRRVTYNDEEREDEDIPALMETEEEGTDSDANKQIILHADFDDDDSEDDQDFIPGEDNEDEDEEIDEEVDDNFDEDAAEVTDQDDEVPGNENAPEELDQSEEAQNDAGINLEPAEEELPAESNEISKVDNHESALKNVPEPRSTEIRKLHSAFPKSPMAVCKYVLNGTNGDMGEAYEAMARGFRPVKSKNAITEILEGTSDLSVPKTRSKAKTPLTTEPGSRDIMDVDPEESPNSVVNHYDQRGLPLGSIKSGKALSFMAEALHSSPSRPRSESRRSASYVSNKSVRFAADEVLSNGLTSTAFIDKESQIEESSEDSDSDSSSEDDAASSDDSNEPSDADENASGDASSSESDSSSDLSSESSSEDESPEETSSKPSSTAPALVNTAPSSHPTNAKSKPPQRQAGEGRQATKMRNQRRRLANALDRYKQKGILPAGTTISELAKMQIDSDTSPEVAHAALQELRAANEAAKPASTKFASKSPSQSKSGEFERRRQQLLDDLASGGVEVGQGSHEGESSAVVQNTVVAAEPEHAPPNKAPERQPVDASLSTAPQQVEPIANAQAVEAIALDARPSTALELPKVDTPLVSPKPLPISAEPNQSTARRSKLDLGASRRLLFGALGVKAPRTKQDEEKLRTDLMKDVRPLVTPKVSDAVQVQAEDVVEDPEAWREKIVYRAVECVQEGVELSEPPFPFVQRWDPQQQRGGKRKQAERVQPQYYQDDSRVSKKQKRRKGKHNYAEEQEYLDASYEPSYQEESIELQYEDSTQFTTNEDEDVEGEISQQLMNDIEAPVPAISQAPDDLASLPDDPSTLPDLRDGEAKVGMTIAFKKLDLSAATQWQPLVSPYRTAIVIAIQEDGILQLTLAMRDRQQTEKRYDEDTGGRIYEKFEMDVDEDMQEEDGMLDLSFGELIDPKIVQEPPPSLENDIVEDVIMDEASQLKEATSLDNSTTLSQQPESTEAQLSHVTETPLYSDAPKSYHVEQSIEVTAAEDPLPGDAVPQVTAVESISGENSLPAEVEPAGDSLPPPIVDETSTVDPTKPAYEVDEEASKGEDVSTEPITEETRQKIAHLMKDANFRPDIPSSVLEDFQPDSMQSPGEAAALEKLLKDMTETENEKAYSPKFNGLGSSPIKKLKGPSASLENPVEEADSSSTRNRINSSLPQVDKRQPSVSPNKPPQSSWETVDPQYQSPSLPPAGQADSSWVTEDSHIRSSSQPVPKLAQASRKVKPPARKVPVSRAQALWEQFQTRSRRNSADSEAESSKTTPDLGLGLDGVDERDSNTTVQYPKLSVGSSFTSQITDHGRQLEPDFNFDDSAVIGAETPKAADFGAYVTGSLSPDRAPERQASQSRAASPIAERDAFDSMSDIEPEFPTPKIVSEKRVEKPTRPVATEDSSDDDLPGLQELSQSATIKRENSQKKSTKPAKISKPNKPRPAQELSSPVAELSGDEGQTTPKASQKQWAPSQSQSSKSRGSEKPASQSRASIPRASQPFPSQSKSKFEPPAGSQVYDLTLDTSDAESEPQPEAEESDDICPVAFRRYQLDDDDDDDEYQDELGWALKKKNSTVGGVETRRHTSVELKPSSQASPNTRNRRKSNMR